MPDQAFKSQKVRHLEDELAKKNPNINHDYIITTKADGWFVYIDYIANFGWQFPRNDKRIIPSMMFTREWFARTIPTPRVSTRFIMEAVIPDTPFHILNGIFNRKSEEAKDVHFRIHDMIELDSFMVNTNDNNAFWRYKRLENTGLPKYYDPVRIGIEPILDISNDIKTWYELFDHAASLGEEGIVLKQADALYQPDSRNSSLMKLKLEAEFDLLCVDFYRTIGEKGNEAWNMLLKNKACETIPVRVGKDSDITKFLSDSPIGKVHQIKCMKKLEDGSYREPRYYTQRYDKSSLEID